MNRIIFGMALAVTVFNLSAAQPAPPVPPNWEPILTRPGAVRLIYGVTINCWSKASKQQVDPALPQNLFLYAELKDGKISDFTRYIKFRNEKKR